MSIYATYLAIDNDEHEPGDCAVWKRASAKKAREVGSYAVGGNRYWIKSGKPCDCKNYPPYVYQGSHVNPGPDDPKGGHLYVCGIPDFCHPDARFTDDRGENAKPVNYLRLSVGEDPATYGGMESGQATLVLDRRQVKHLRRALDQWIECHPREPA